jgi:hypothetical protein
VFTGSAAGPYTDDSSPHPSYCFTIPPSSNKQFQSPAFCGACVAPKSDDRRGHLGIIYSRKLKLTNVGWPLEA